MQLGVNIRHMMSGVGVRKEAKVVQYKCVTYFYHHLCKIAMHSATKYDMGIGNRAQRLVCLITCGYEADVSVVICTPRTMV